MEGEPAAMGLALALAGSLGRVIGVMLSEPNWASRKRKRRSRRSEEERLECRLRVGMVWEWECLLEDSAGC